MALVVGPETSESRSSGAAEESRTLHHCFRLKPCILGKVGERSHDETTTWHILRLLIPMTKHFDVQLLRSCPYGPLLPRESFELWGTRLSRACFSQITQPT